MILFEGVIQDLRYASRTLFRNPGFTTVSVFALALGIGVNTVAFTAYRAFVARPLDARDPGTLVNLAVRLQSGATDARFSYPDYEAYRDHLHSLSGVIAFSIDQFRLTGAGIPNGSSTPAEYGTPVLNVNPDLEIFAYVLAISVFAGILFGLAPAIESSGSALLSTVRGAGNFARS
jgi:hypothetical protein